MAAYQMFLKLGDIVGDALDAQHRGEIEILTFAWGPAPEPSTKQLTLVKIGMR